MKLVHALGGYSAVGQPCDQIHRHVQAAEDAFIRIVTGETKDTEGMSQMASPPREDDGGQHHQLLSRYIRNTPLPTDEGGSSPRRLMPGSLSESGNWADEPSISAVTTSQPWGMDACWGPAYSIAQTVCLHARGHADAHRRRAVVERGRSRGS